MREVPKVMGGPDGHRRLYQDSMLRGAKGEDGPGGPARSAARPSKLRGVPALANLDDLFAAGAFPVRMVPALDPDCSRARLRGSRHDFALVHDTPRRGD
jgi:hypothetical protein